MNMVFVSFHSYDAVSFRITDIVYLLLYIVSYSPSEYLLAILSYKNDMCFQTVFASVATIVSVFHRKSLKTIDFH